MKKLLSILMLLVAIVTGASAATTWTFRAADIKSGASFAPKGTNVFVADDGKELTYKGNSDKDALVATAATIGGVSYSSYVNLNGATSSGRYMYVEGISGTGTLSIVFASGKSNNKEITINDNAYDGTEIASINSTEANLNGTKQDIEITTSLNAEHKYYINGQRSVYAVIWTPSETPAKDYTVTAASNNNSYGTAATSASSLDEGETATITATPKTGYEFISWAVEGEGSTLSSTTTNPTTLTMGTANTTVTATFSAINYTIAHNAAEGGTYTISVAGGDATDANTTATIGQTITLAGTPADPAKPYIRWNVKDANEAPVTVINNQFTMPASNVTIAPVFSKPLNTLFEMKSITSAGGDLSKGDKADVVATFTDGGSAEVYQNANSGNMYYNGSINLNGSGSSYLHVTFPSALQAGDVITATFLGGEDAWKLSKTTSGAANKSNPYTLAANDALIGATDLYIFKNGSAQVSALKIEGEGVVSDFTITSSTTPVVAIGTESTIEYTTSSTGDITFATSDASVATVTNEGVITGKGGGTATITINQAADATYRPGSAKVTVTVPEIALFKIKILGGTSTSITGTIDVENDVTADVNVSSNRKMDKGKFAGFTLNGDYSLQTGDIVEVSVTTKGDDNNSTFKFYNNTGDSPTMLYDTGVKATEAKIYRFVMPAAMNGVKTTYLRRGGDDSGINEGFNPVLGYIAVYRPNAVVTLNAKGFATYSSSYDFEYLGADAYGMELTATSLSGTKVTTGKIKAGEGILFKGEAGATVAITETTGAAALANNSLIGTTDINNEVISPLSYAYKYALSGDTFKKFTGALVANKAFFGTNEELSNSLDLVFDGATAINNVNANDNANSAAPVKVIKNGKLYIGNYNVAGQQVK